MIGAPGTYVQICGLVAASQYNGKMGIVRSFNGQRYGVELLSPQRPKRKVLAVRPDNIKVLLVDAAAAAASQNTAPDVPVGDHSADDDAQCEAVSRYMAQARSLFDHGKTAEELQMYEWMAAKGHKQPSVHLNLFLRYSNDHGDFRDYDRAFDCLVGCIEFLVDPSLELLPPDPSSIPEGSPSSDDENDDTASSNHLFEMNELMGILVCRGMEFINEKRVIGRNGHELVPEARVLKALYHIALRSKIDYDNDECFQMNHEVRSDILYHLGNIYRKIGNDNDNAIKSLKLSDLEHITCYTEMMKRRPQRELPTGCVLYRHNYDALFLLLDVLMLEATIATGTEAKHQKVQMAVDEARRVLVFMNDEEEEYAGLYRGQIKLATILYNQMAVTKQHPESMLIEVYDLLMASCDKAKMARDDHYHTMATNLLNMFEKVPEVPSENNHRIGNSNKSTMSNPRAEESSKSVHSILEQSEQYMPKSTLPMDSPSPEKVAAMENTNGMELSTTKSHELEHEEVDI